MYGIMEIVWKCANFPLKLNFRDFYSKFPFQVAKLIPKDRLMSESEWRSYGIQQVKFNLFSLQTQSYWMVQFLLLRRIFYQKCDELIIILMRIPYGLQYSCKIDMFEFQSVGWEHYMIHDPERHVLLFRRPLPRPPSQFSSASTKDRRQVGVR